MMATSLDVYNRFAAIKAQLKTSETLVPENLTKELTTLQDTIAQFLATAQKTDNVDLQTATLCLQNDCQKIQKKCGRIFDQQEGKKIFEKTQLLYRKAEQSLKDNVLTQDTLNELTNNITLLQNIKKPPLPFYKNCNALADDISTLSTKWELTKMGSYKYFVEAFDEELLSLAFNEFSQEARYEQIIGRLQTLDKQIDGFISKNYPHIAVHISTEKVEGASFITGRGFNTFVEGLFRMKEQFTHFGTSAYSFSSGQTTNSSLLSTFEDMQGVSSGPLGTSELLQTLEPFSFSEQTESSGLFPILRSLEKKPFLEKNRDLRNGILLSQTNSVFQDLLFKTAYDMIPGNALTYEEWIEKSLGDSIPLLMDAYKQLTGGEEKKV